MNKVTELLDAVAHVITNVRNLADSLQVVADVLTDMKSVEVTESQPVSFGCDSLLHCFLYTAINIPPQHCDGRI